jgi:hypothetical protein
MPDSDATDLFRRLAAALGIDQPALGQLFGQQSGASAPAPGSAPTVAGSLFGMPASYNVAKPSYQLKGSPL